MKGEALTRRIGLGIVSYAHPHAAMYAAAIAAHPNVDFIGIAGLGLNADLGHQEANRYGVPYYDDYEQLLQSDQLTGIYIGTEPLRHLEVCSRAANLGKDILCDKPIALTLEEADAIIRVAEEARVKLMVPFNPRFQLPLMKIKQALDSGEAGDLVSIFAIKYGKLPTKIPGPAQYGWLLDPDQAGGGGFFDIGIHAIDGMRWLADSEAQRVYAQIGTMIHDGLEVDDIGLLTTEFQNGVVATLSAGWCNPDGYPTWLDVRFEILTTEAAFLVDSPYHHYAYYSPEKAEKRYWWRRDVAAQVNEFATAILDDRDPAITGPDAKAALSISLAGYESAHTGQVVIL